VNVLNWENDLNIKCSGGESTFVSNTLTLLRGRWDDQGGGCKHTNPTYSRGPDESLLEGAGKQEPC